MTDIWSFLLQTLTATGAAFLLFGVKAIFTDKLSPRWQFGVWGVLAVVLLLPAGWGGRYILTNWPLMVEMLKSTLTGEFGTLTRVTAPVPLPSFAAPRSAADWVYLVYVAGVVLLLARYVISYIRLRRALKRGRSAPDGQIRAVAERYGLPICPAVEVDGLPTAFICGVFRPVLALPAGVETDDKVILHELLHLKYKDVAWGWLIALFRCLHWCNPFIWVCAHWAGSDLESLCDQRVLERLEGEERRDYGRILLSMADEKYAHAPGTSSAANGGKNIRRRIEAIARFKRYPAGMALVSVCVALVLLFPLVTGSRADTVVPNGKPAVAMASARTTWCTTYAGAFDTYAKALLTGNAAYWAMCAPLSQQNELAEQFAQGDWGRLDWEQFGLGNGQVEFRLGYDLYNLTPAGEDAWEGVLVIELQNPPNGVVWDGLVAHRWLAIQPLRAEKEGERWVILPQGEVQMAQGDQRSGGNLAVPAWVYEGQHGDFTIRIQWQTVASVNSYTQSDGIWAFPVFDTVPKPHAELDRTERSYLLYALYTGNPADKGEYKTLRVEYTPVYDGAEQGRPKVTSERTRWGERDLEEHWSEYDDSWIFLVGGGGGYEGEGAETNQFPSAYAVNLYLNNELTAELTLLPKGGEWLEP